MSDCLAKIRKLRQDANAAAVLGNVRVSPATTGLDNLSVSESKTYLAQRKQFDRELRQQASQLQRLVGR